MSENFHAMNLNPWEQGFCWFWCNDDEIFFYTEEDFERRAEELAKSGVTVIMTFSLTHFRMGFYPYWRELNESLAKLVRACHKWGIRVVEHHSASLTSRVLDEGGWEKLDGEICRRSKNTAKYDHWKRIFPFLTYDYTIDGVDIRSFMQIDGRTGEWARNRYGTFSACYNNPDYRRIYFDYVKSVVATGIDGIMNDDVQFFGDGHACTCEHCRRLFTEQTGYTLPDPEHWSEFADNYDDPAFIAWKKFRFDSTERMYRDLGAFYEELGVKLLRPNYSSCVLKECPTSYPFDLCSDVWDFIFQENCNADIMKESYMDFMAESVHRFAAGRQRGVPTMSLFYPDRPDSVYFSWALARSWGQLYTGTASGMDITPMEVPYRRFEKKYLQFYASPRKVSDLAFYFSRRTRDFTKSPFTRFMRHMMGSMQAAYVSGFRLDMVMEEDSLESLLTHKTIVLSYVAMLSEGERRRFETYVRAGGNLIILGDFALYAEDGRKRGEDEIMELFGARLVANEAVGLGKGSVYLSDFRPDEVEFQPTVGCKRGFEPPVTATAVPSKWDAQREGTGKLLRSLLKPQIEIVSENDRLVATAFDVEGARVLHIVNLADTISAERKAVSHEDPIPNFCEGAKKLGAFTVRLSDIQFEVSRACLLTPERETPVSLQIRRADGALAVEIPSDTFAAYAMIVLERDVI